MKMSGERWIRRWTVLVGFNRFNRKEVDCHTEMEMVTVGHPPHLRRM